MYFSIIDIGSNSIRMVVYQSFERVPKIIFNEKEMVGLGRELGRTGRIGVQEFDDGLRTLRRFRLLCDHMDVNIVDVIATSAVRDAENGQKFKEEAESQTGFKIHVISGEREAELSGYGVIAGHYRPIGLAGDLGGGSLEFANIENDHVTSRCSLPLGPLRLSLRFGKDFESLTAFLRPELRGINGLKASLPKNFYPIGGAWRNIGCLYLLDKGLPISALHGFTVNSDQLCMFLNKVIDLEDNELKGIETVSARRIEVLPIAALTLKCIIEEQAIGQIIFTSYGLREGTIYSRLTPAEKKQDPLIAHCYALACERSRFAEHAELLYQWTRPLFKSEVRPDTANLQKTDGPCEITQERIHYAAALLSDSAWRTHPNFRASKAAEIVLHNQMIGMHFCEKLYLAVALYHTYTAKSDDLEQCIPIEYLPDQYYQQARILGASLRLAQKLSAGVDKALLSSRLTLNEKELILQLNPGFNDLVTPKVLARLNQLAELITRDIKIV